MDIPRPDGFNETYLYEGGSIDFTWHAQGLTTARAHGV